MPTKTNKVCPIVNVCYVLLFPKFRNNRIDLLELNRLTRHKKQMYKKLVNQAYLDTTEYEIVPRDPTFQETPIQKLRSLKFEVQELEDEIKKRR